MEEPVHLMDDYWLDEPSEIGQTLFVYGNVDGVDYTVALQADRTERGDTGWVRVSGIAIGQFGSHSSEEAAADRGAQFVYEKPFADIRPLFGRIAASADSDLRAFEDTRRIRRDLDARRLHSAFEPGKRLRIEKRSEELRVVATIYDLVKNKYGLRNTSHFISGYLGCSIRTAEERVREAKRRGLIKEGTAQEASEKKPTVKTKKRGK